MTNESVFLITEIWLNPSRIEEFKAYRIRLSDLMQKFHPEYVYHGHPFAWALETNEGNIPTGVEVLRFETEAVAKQALDAIKESGLLTEGNTILEKTRCYLAQYQSASWTSA